MCVFVEEIPRGGRIIQQILQARREGRLCKQFTRQSWERECPGWSRSTYLKFLHKHRVGNGKTTERFTWNSDGSYSLLGEYADCKHC